MKWILILVTWFLAPFVEFGIIVVLAVLNSRYKQQIEELSKRRDICPIPEKDITDEPCSVENSNPITVFSDDKIIQAESPTDKIGQPQIWTDETALAESQIDKKMQKETQVNETVWNGNQKAQVNNQNHLGTIALILGVIFVILAGLIFATTTWHILPDLYKASFVLICAGLFFGISFLSEKIFHIHKTSNAFYILGSVFLFLSILAAAYFKLLGPEFILEGKNRWKVLWVGSLLMELSFFAGLRQFNDRIYTQTSLWGISANLFFFIKSCSMNGNGLVSVMMVYASILIIIQEYLDRPVISDEKPGFVQLISSGFQSFTPVHFLFFGSLTFIRGFFTAGWMLYKGYAGIEPLTSDYVSSFSFPVLETAAMISLVLGLYILSRKKKDTVYSHFLPLAEAEAICSIAGWISPYFIYQMLFVNMVFLFRKGVRFLIWKKKGIAANELFWDICECSALVITIMNFYNGKGHGIESLVFCLAAFLGYTIWFYLGRRQWPHLLASIAIQPLPFVVVSRQILTLDQLYIWVFAALLVSGILARWFSPIAEQDSRVEGGWRMDWYHILAIFTILLMAETANARWRFFYTLLTALYFLQYTTVAPLKKISLFLSSCFLSAAFLRQPFIQWPQMLELELRLLPMVWLIWISGVIWKEISWIRCFQTVSYITCLLILFLDAVVSCQVADALLLEGICLSIFIWAQIKKDLLWIRISGILILLMALFTTRSFWLSISWWIYLLAAGMGLILFAAVLEKKRRQP